MVQDHYCRDDQTRPDQTLSGNELVSGINRQQGEMIQRSVVVAQHYFVMKNLDDFAIKQVYRLNRLHRRDKARPADC